MIAGFFVDVSGFSMELLPMPISGPASFLPTTDEFIAHWASANSALGVPIVLKGVAIANLTALRSTLQDQRALVEVARNGCEGARASIEAAKAGMLLWLNRFNAKLESATDDVKWLAMRPNAFQQNDGMAKVTSPLDDASDVWSRYDAESGTPLTLIGGTTATDFYTGVADLKDFYIAYKSQNHGLELARANRNATQETIRAILVNYRQRIPAEFAEGSPILATLPRYSPLPGHTPEPVVASGLYDPGTETANLSWTQSTDSALTQYEVRGVAGPDYDADDESVVANIAPGAARVWAGNFALGAPGTSASFRIYVMTDTGNERASNTVTLSRPA